MRLARSLPSEVQTEVQQVQTFWKVIGDYMYPDLYEWPIQSYQSSILRKNLKSNQLL